MVLSVESWSLEGAGVMKGSQPLPEAIPEAESNGERNTSASYFLLYFNLQERISFTEPNQKPPDREVWGSQPVRKCLLPKV